ncbi:hypothetical protein ACIRG4_01800 [Streptomyces sp. NPDC102395]|uniref:hypothetical protein n=1 Tax=Streptomyces sp. NPDC102395 TaxID=3366168 RepID=UPI0038159F78
MTHRAQNKWTHASSGSSADVLGRGATPGRAGFLELLGMTLAAGVLALSVVRPELPAAFVHALVPGSATTGPRAGTCSLTGVLNR